jgi:hypothetical protein
VMDRPEYCTKLDVAGRNTSGFMVRAITVTVLDCTP